MRNFTIFNLKLNCVKSLSSICSSFCRSSVAVFAHLFDLRFELDFVYKIPGVFKGLQGVFKNQKLSFQGVFVTRFLCHTLCFSVFAEKAYIDNLSHILRVKCTQRYFNFSIQSFPNCLIWAQVLKYL